MLLKFTAVEQAKKDLEIEVFAANQEIESRNFELLEKEQTLSSMAALVESL